MSVSEFRGTTKDHRAACPFESRTLDGVGGLCMRFIEAVCNHEASAFGEATAFLVVELTEHDEDVSYLVDQGTHFSSVQQLQRHLARVTGDEVHVLEIALACEP